MNGWAGRKVEVSAVRKRSVMLDGRRTSISLEDKFWESLKQIAAQEGKTLQGLVTQINATRTCPNLSSAIRVAILDYVIKTANAGLHVLTPHLAAAEQPSPGYVF